MTETKWTRGPWHCEGTRIKDASGEEVAVATKASPKNRHQATNNADLIAAAPELYEALAAMMSDRVNGPGSLPIWKQAVAALAKARGEAQ